MKPTLLNTDSPGEDSVTRSDKPVMSNELANEQPRKTSMKDTVEFNVKNFYAMIEKNGLLSNWEQSFMCPCVNPVTLSPDPDCEICHGTGRGYMPAKKGVRIVIQENGKGKRLNQYGQYDTGTAQGSVQIGYRVSAWDRITVPDFTVRQQYLFNVTEQRTENGHFIPYDVKEILYIAYMDEDKHLKKATEGVDFTFDRELDKIYPTVNMIGYNMTIVMNVTMRYIVTDVDKELRYQYTERNLPEKKFDELPRHVILKREEAFVNNIPLVNPSTKELTTKASQSQINEVSVSDTDSGFGL